MVTTLFPLLLIVIGALVYGFATNKAMELGRLTFLAGIIALALHTESCAKLLHIG
jgi:hypothetical protein